MPGISLSLCCIMSDILSLILRVKKPSQPQIKKLHGQFFKHGNNNKKQRNELIIWVRKCPSMPAVMTPIQTFFGLNARKNHLSRFVTEKWGPSVSLSLCAWQKRPSIIMTGDIPRPPIAAKPQKRERERERVAHQREKNSFKGRRERLAIVGRRWREARARQGKTLMMLGTG